MTNNPKNIYFEEIIDLLHIIKNKINSTTDINWTLFDSKEELISELDNTIKQLENCDHKALQKIKIAFAPTGTFQELSLTNGWGDEYLILAAKFDIISKNISSDTPTHGSQRK